jgi:hypothetical protein
MSNYIPNNEELKNCIEKINNIMLNFTKYNDVSINAFSNLSEHINTQYNWLALTTSLSVINFIIITIYIIAIETQNCKS